MEQFGRYQLVRRLAFGGMAEIFLAREGGQQLVVKRILPHLADNRRFVGMFLSEAKHASSMSHANIVRIFDHGEIDGQCYIAMEYVDGLSMAGLMARAKASGDALPAGFWLRLTLDCCAGLAFAHALKDATTGEPLGLVHRDISPHNLLVSFSGVAKVADWGIARAVEQTHVTQTGQLLGKVPYMAPEQLYGLEADARSDLFSLAIVLYEALAGRHPFHDGPPAGMMRAILEVPPQPIRALRPDLPARLAAALERALAKQREHRFPGCAAFMEELQAISQEMAAPSPGEIVTRLSGVHLEEPVEGRQRAVTASMVLEPDPTRVVGPTRRSPPWIAIGLGVALGLLATGAAAWSVLRAPEKTELPPAVEARTERPAPPAADPSPAVIPPPAVVPPPAPAPIHRAAAVPHPSKNPPPPHKPPPPPVDDEVERASRARQALGAP